MQEPFNEKKYQPLKNLCENEEQFRDLTLKLSLVNVILSQVNEIFTGSLYAETGSALIKSAFNSVQALQESLIEKYIQNSVETGQLMPVPEIEDLTVWVEGIHLDIISQLYSEGFVDSVFAPAMTTISQNIVEFAKEEAGENSDEKENLNEMDN